MVFTENAAAKVWELIEEDGNLALNLRLSVSGGGCSGFQYQFTFDEVISEDDHLVSPVVAPINAKEDLYLLVDPISFLYLKDAEIDYVEDIKGSEFVIRNPDAKTTCGCGSSFSV